MKSKQLKELRRKILFFTVATSMSCSLNGCNNNKDKIYEKQDNTSTEITSDNYIYQNNEELISSENIELTEFLKYSNQIIPTYKYEDLYLSETEVNNLINKAYNNKNCDYVYDNNIDDVLNDIRINSMVFLIRNKGFSSVYEEFESKYKIDFNEILKEVLQSIINESTNNINEDICNLKTLTIVINCDTPIDVLAYYDRDKNMIAINIDAIEREKELSINHDLLKIIKKTLRHELNHLRQYPCECRQSKGQLDESLKYDNYYNSILMESSAESEIYNISEEYRTNISKNSFTYYNQREDESLILLLGLFNENIELTDYYNAIFDSDIKGLYNYVGADTKEEIYELYKILYSIDALNLRNDLGKYLLKKSKNNISHGELQNLVGYGYKVEIFKKVLENMAIYTEKNYNFTLEENITMLNIIKNSITINSYVIEESNDINDFAYYKYIYEDSFVQDIYNLENNYVKYLSNHYNCEIDTIREIENDSTVKILTNINYISQGIEPAYHQYKDIANSVYEKFPIIKAIAYSNSSIQYGYSNFLKNNNLTLMKKYE